MLYVRYLTLLMIAAPAKTRYSEAEADLCLLGAGFSNFHNPNRHLSLHTLTNGFRVATNSFDTW